MLAAGAGLTGLITAATMTGEPFYIVGIGGAIGAMIMMGITMLIANLIYILGVGVVPAASKVNTDWITKRNQEIYKTPGTEGHGVPLTSFVSGLIGGLLGGFGGGLVYFAMYDSLKAVSFVTDAAMNNTIAIGLAAILGVGVFFINSVIASYNIGGTIEGMHDPKFKRIGTGAIACAIASIVVGIFCIIITGGI
jgi:tetrahydromethanopterin S-methyltransferase subunit D